MWDTYWNGFSVLLSHILNQDRNKWKNKCCGLCLAARVSKTPSVEFCTVHERGLNHGQCFTIKNDTHLLLVLTSP